MRGTRRVSLGFAAVLVLITAGVAWAQITIPITEEKVLYEAIGEFNNSGPASQQYGYLSSVTGLDNVFSSTTTKNETTALSHCAHNRTAVSRQLTPPLFIPQVGSADACANTVGPGKLTIAG